MTDRALCQLRRDELLDMLLEIEQENEALSRENAELRRKLDERRLMLSEVGSIAEASLALSGVFAAAQEAADMYLVGAERHAREREAQADVYVAQARKACLAYAKETERLCVRPVAGDGHQSLLSQIEALFAEESRERESDHDLDG